MSALFDLTGKTALVTGGSRGLGFAMAKALGEHGAKLVINGTNKDKLQQAASELRALAVDVEILPFDVTSEKAVQEAFLQLDQKGIHIDILVNNAGIQFRSPLVDLSLADWDRVIQTDLTSAFLVGQQAARRMIEKKTGGKIINIGSLLSCMGRRTIAPYAAAKGGIKLLTQTMAGEWAEHNIQANAIGPGYMLTDMNEALINNQEFDQWVCSRTPAKRWGKPEELGGAVVFLASEASSYVNGQILYVDGGMLAVL